MPSSALLASKPNYGTPSAQMRDVDVAGQHRPANGAGTQATAAEIWEIAEDSASAADLYTTDELSAKSDRGSAGRGSATGRSGGGNYDECDSSTSGEQERKRKDKRRKDCATGATNTATASAATDSGADAAAASASAILGRVADG
jgi:hypothetical protein